MNIRYADGILIFQLIAYASIVPMIMFAGWQHYLIAIVAYFCIGGLGMIMGYHRLLTHRSFKCSKWFEHMITYFATLSLTGPALDWIAIHREHHKFGDTENDPHSPDYKGRLRVHFLTMYTPVSIKYAGKDLRNKFLLFQRKHYFLINIITGLILYLIDPFAVIYLWLFPAALTIGFGTLILSVSHRDKAPHNDFILGILTWGDGFHKEHHDNPGKVRLHKYDLIGLIIEKFFIRGKPV
jgi:sn-1 stearoyl-lipid 9-desaturase